MRESQAFPIAILDEDYEGRSAAGRGMQQLAAAIEEHGFRVVAGLGYKDAQRLAKIFNNESCWLVSVDGSEDSTTKWQILEEVLAERGGAEALRVGDQGEPAVGRMAEQLGRERRRRVALARRRGLASGAVLQRAPESLFVARRVKGLGHRGRPRPDRGAHRRVAAGHEARQARFELASLEEDVAAAALAAQADVGAEAVHEPRAGATGMGAPEREDIAEEDLDDRSAGHRREIIRGGVSHRSAFPGAPLRAGSSIRSG